MTTTIPHFKGFTAVNNLCVSLSACYDIKTKHVKGVNLHREPLNYLIYNILYNILFMFTLYSHKLPKKPQWFTSVNVNFWGLNPMFINMLGVHDCEPLKGFTGVISPLSGIPTVPAHKLIQS